MPPTSSARPTATGPALPYNAHWGYRRIDARRWERRRYGGLLRRLDRFALERTLRRALRDVPRGARVLDAACGTAMLAPALAEAGWRVLGADVSATMLARALPRLGVGGIRCDVTRLPLRDGAVAGVVCTRFLPHLPAPLRPIVLRELARVCCGPVVVTMSGSGTVKQLLRVLRRWAGFPRHSSTRWVPLHVLAGEAAEAGLEIAAVHRVAPLLSSVRVVVLTPPAARTMLG